MNHAVASLELQLSEARREELNHALEAKEALIKTLISVIDKLKAELQEEQNIAVQCAHRVMDCATQTECDLMDCGMITGCPVSWADVTERKDASVKGASTPCFSSEEEHDYVREEFGFTSVSSKTYNVELNSTIPGYVFCEAMNDLDLEHGGDSSPSANRIERSQDFIKKAYKNLFQCEDFAYMDREVMKMISVRYNSKKDVYYAIITLRLHRDCESHMIMWDALKNDNYYRMYGFLDEKSYVSFKLNERSPSP